MKNIKFCLFLACLIMIASCGTKLNKANWYKPVYNTLNQLIDSCGVKNPNYNPNLRPYAVFDFDNTTLINDIELTFMYYQLKNLRFNIKPENMYDVLTNCIPNVDTTLKLFSGDMATTRALAIDASNDYKFLYDNYIKGYLEAENKKEYEKNISKIQDSDEYQDFKAKVWAIAEGTYTTFDYKTSCIWILNLLEGMTNSDVEILTKEAADEAFKVKHPHNIEWKSPIMGQAKQISVTIPIGLKITDSMKELYSCLRLNGIDVYICSASLETIVAAIACDPKYGLNVNRNNIFGVRLVVDKQGYIQPQLVEDYYQTYQKGKADAIKAYISPRYNGNQPILVAGDSNGDYAMLTQFDKLKVGLIINCGSGKPLSNLYKLANKADSLNEGLLNDKTRYLLQGRNPYLGKLINSSKSIPFESEPSPQQ